MTYIFLSPCNAYLGKKNSANLFDIKKKKEKMLRSVNNRNIISRDALYLNVVKTRKFSGCKNNSSLSKNQYNDILEDGQYSFNNGCNKNGWSSCRFEAVIIMPAWIANYNEVHFSSRGNQFQIISVISSDQLYQEETYY